MDILLILFVLYFGVVVFWAGPRLYRLLRARTGSGRRLALGGAADRIGYIKPVPQECLRDPGKRGQSC